MKKYNIALLPISKTEAFISLSQSFLIINPIYHLGRKSLPHVTLCQFYLEENEINAIWEEVCATISDYALDLEFKSFSFITFDNFMFWISLIPECIPELHKLHAEVATVLKVSTKRPYDPHLTLISTLDSTYKRKAAPLIEEYCPIIDRFTLAVGECDELGQFINFLN